MEGNGTEELTNRIRLAIERIGGPIRFTMVEETKAEPNDLQTTKLTIEVETAIEKRVIGLHKN